MNGVLIFVEVLRRRGTQALALLIFLSFLGGASLLAQTGWTAVGPAGGDARAFAAVPGHPEHLYLGTTNSWLYESLDGGASWHRLAHINHSNGLILDHIVVDAADPGTIYVAAWQVDRPGGGLWISHDAGRTWSEAPGLRGQSIRAFAQAPSDPKILFAGTLQGVFRSEDAGATWTQISPAGSREIHEVESLAVDPKNPQVVYAGTWHLPWKTANGGQSWRNIKHGIIDDSDVFSIIVDPGHTQTVYLSACSGIYKSLTAGDHFSKIQGIPSSARRTRVIKQDPANRETVYAGTTEGLYKTENGGRSFRRMTGGDVIVNDVFIDPQDPQHVLLATDRSGVLVSRNGGETFVQSNQGFSERKVAALLVDRRDPRRIYAGVVNDKTYGGAFVSTDGGASWTHVGQGLDGRDVFSLAQTSSGDVVAGTNHGIFLLDPPAAAGAADASPLAGLVWEPRNLIANTVVKTATETHYGTRVNIEKKVKAPPIELESRVNALDVSSDVWLAATSYGLLTSHDQGASWQGGPVMGQGEYLTVAVHKGLMVAARSGGAVYSTDGGQSWWPIGLPTMVTRIHCIAFSPDGTLWLAAREGVYFTRDKGKSWLWIERLPFRDVDDLSYDPALGRMLASSRSSDLVYAIDLKTMSWLWWQTGYQVAQIRAAGDRLVAASLNEGVLVEPVAAAGEAHRK